MAFFALPGRVVERLAHTRAIGWPIAPWRAANMRLVAGEQPGGVSGRPALNLALLAVLGAGIVLLNCWMARWRVVPEHPRAFMLLFLGQLALYAVAAVWVTARRLPLRGALAIIVLVALASRLAFVAQAPTVSDDIYRYVWDGRIQAAGINPYRHAPADPALAAYRDRAIYPFINRKAVPTIYPPVAQAIFRAIYSLHRDSVAWTRIAFIGFDLLTIAVIAGLLSRLGLRPERVLLYAWHPLLILELGHSGHIDIVTICFLTLALRARLSDRPWRAGFLLACAALTKFYALIALPALLFQARRRDFRLPLALMVTMALAYLPFLSVGPAVFGYLGGYVQEEGIASGDRFYPLALLKLWRGGTLPALMPPWGLPPLGLAQLYAGGLLLVMGALALWCWLRPVASLRAIPARVLLLFAVFIALATPTYPWYSLLALAFVPFVGKRLLTVALVLVSGAGFLYLQWWWPASGGWVRAIAYGGGLFGLLLVVIASVVRLSRHRRDDAQASSVTTEPASLFDRFPWLYIICREWLFRDHTARIVAALWPSGTPQSGARVLEVGCGPGLYARRMARRFGQLQVLGLDRSPAQLRRASARATAERLDNCRFVLGDARALTQPAGTIDAIVASRLFTILPEREQSLAEMHRVLRAGGRCFIAEPRSRFWTALPLRALWFLARVACLGGHAPRKYREPTSATVLTDAAFLDLLHSQPWGAVSPWHDRQYHYALCEKAAPRSAVEALAAD